MRAKIVTRLNPAEFYGIRFNCPGCALMRGTEDWPDDGEIILPTRWTPPGLVPNTEATPHWDFNGDLALPVFGPSILSHYDTSPNKRLICHSFIGCNGARPGQIIFLPDSTHALAGQTVDLPDIEA